MDGIWLEGFFPTRISPAVFSGPRSHIHFGLVESLWASERDLISCYTSNHPTIFVIYILIIYFADWPTRQITAGI